MQFAYAQVTIDDSDSMLEQDGSEELELKEVEVDGDKKVKVDGVAAVVGNYLIIESDIQKLQMDAKEQGLAESETTNCKILERIMEQKLLAHHAVQDSLMISEEQLLAQTEQQIMQFEQQVGSMQKLLDFYNKDSEQELKEELLEINTERAYSDEMRSKIVDDLEVTPEETRQFFESIPDDEVPIFGDEVEVAQIVIEPEVGEEQIQKVKDQLNEYRDEVLNEGKSFATRAVFYSKDRGTAKNGGKITLTKSDPFVKEFKDAAFSLAEGEVSKPFKTDFGYHILTVEKIRGQQVEVRHILLYPEVTNEAIETAKEKAEKLRAKIEKGELDFAEAAREFSDEEETRENGGQLVNSANGDKRFELSKMDPELYGRVYNLAEGEMSRVIPDEDRRGNKSFKIFKVTKKIDEHKADFSKDYPKIKDLALRQKQLKEVERWKKIKAKETYIKLNSEYKSCNFAENWIDNL